MAEGIEEIEIDHRWHFLGPKNKKWILQALDGHSGRTIGWVAGGDGARMKKLYRKLERLSDTNYVK